MKGITMKAIMAFVCLAAVLAACSRNIYIKVKVLGEISKIDNEASTFDVALPQEQNVWELSISGQEAQTNKALAQATMIVKVNNRGDKPLTVTQLQGQVLIRPGEEAVIYKGTFDDFDRGQYMTYISPGGGGVHYRLTIEFGKRIEIAGPIKVLAVQRHRDL
jgi:hypothetical protein